MVAIKCHAIQSANRRNRRRAVLCAAFKHICAQLSINHKMIKRILAKFHIFTSPINGFYFLSRSYSIPLESALFACSMSLGSCYCVCFFSLSRSPTRRLRIVPFLLVLSSLEFFFVLPRFALFRIYLRDDSCLFDFSFLTALLRGENF